MSEKDTLDIKDQEAIDCLRKLQEITGNKGNVFPHGIDHDWFNRLVQVYTSLNIIGYQLDTARKMNEPPTTEQMQIYLRSIQEFYRLLELAGAAQLDDPTVEDVI